MNHQTALQHFADHLKHADGLLITAGAGMGVDSGLPDFRGEEGFWRAYPPLRHLNLNFENMSTPKLLDEQPRLAWGFQGLMLKSFREVQPHQGFYLLKQWSDNLPNLSHGSFIFTSNVDGEFQKAGFREEQIFEIHGSVYCLQCANNCKPAIWSSDVFEPIVDESQCQLISDLPTCPYCGGLARPNTRLFDDYRFYPMREDEKERYMNDWLKKVNDLAIIELGAGTSIANVRNFGEKLVRYSKDKTVSLLRTCSRLKNMLG
ncbi:SIR2 family NAD-dependent protein deacylase [Moraxella atlantae]|uniref:protein acetyllysine N-acetyltransferase n=1 Tax=Faucicola atlantae TaxID=34059 RepID=A0A378Q0U5_9GAMM|nr:Sir2 family NAD-dependent protein deacetylase [Moraxella atlantae]OPH36060.1 NAD-dependent deacetylase [Moraxella atlantae]STY94342.1 NAD-dependent deacetylase [Moraxella atlantae]